MRRRELFSIILFKAISPIFTGSGFSTSAVDLPIQRERHTGWPHIQASAVKGALREHYRKYSKKEYLEEINRIFGSDNFNDEGKIGDKDGLASEISISDAKLLFFPVRSNIAPFIYVTSPSVLKRLNVDLEFTGLESHKIKFDDNVSDDEAFLLKGKVYDDRVILEDLVVNVAPQKDQVNSFFTEELDNILLISDEMFEYCVTNYTEVQTRISIDSEKGTTKEGSLRYQELLPSDTVIYSVVYFGYSSKDNLSDNEIERVNDLKAENIRNFVKESVKDFVQLGGDETLGRGICKVKWLDN